MPQSTQETIYISRLRFIYVMLVSATDFFLSSFWRSRCWQTKLSPKNGGFMGKLEMKRHSQAKKKALVHTDEHKCVCVFVERQTTCLPAKPQNQMAHFQRAKDI